MPPGGGVFGQWNGGNVNASQCTTSTATVPLLRCVAASGSAAIATGVCGDFQADNTLTLATRPNGALLAVTGHSRTGSPLHVGGSFVSLGGIEATNTEDLDGSLFANGDVKVSSPMTVGGDATIAGALDASNKVSIKGALHLSSPLSDNSTQNVSASSIENDAVATASPLDCAHAPDPAALVSTLGIDEGDSLANVTSPTTVSLGCGTYSLSAVAINNTLDLHVDGHTVMVVEGDFHVASPFHVTIAAGASLDLLVGGSLLVDNTFDVTQTGGLTDAQSGAWVGVGGQVHVAAPFTLDGWLLAPKGALGVDNTVALTGAAYVGSLRVSSPVNVAAGPSFDAVGCVLP